MSHQQQSRTNFYSNSSFINPSISSFSSRNAHYQYYDRRLRTQQTVQSNGTPITTYSTPRSHYEYPSSTAINDLGEPISVFHDIQSSSSQLSRVSAIPITHKPPKSMRPPSHISAQLAAANSIRQRILENIERDLTEIEDELTSLRSRTSLSSSVLPRLSPLKNNRQASSQEKVSPSRTDSSKWPAKSKRVYQVVPSITRESSRRTLHTVTPASELLTPKPHPHIENSTAFIGRYHYGPEAEETEIKELDPENSDLKSTVDEISNCNFPETCAPSQFYHEESGLIKDRALIFVPQFVDSNGIEVNELTEELQQKDPIDTNSIRPSTVESLHDLTLNSKLNIQDYRLLIQTAPEHKTPVVPVDIKTSTPVPLEKPETSVNNTILSKAVKHSRISVRTEDTLSISSQAMKTSTNMLGNDVNYFFSDFGNEYDGEEDHISIDPYSFVPPTDSELISEDNISNFLMRQSQTSLPNPHASQQQQLQTIESNNPYAKETEKKKIDTQTQRIVSPISTSPSMKMLRISIEDPERTHLNKSNGITNNGDQETLKSVSLNMSTNKYSAADQTDHISPTASARQITNKLAYDQTSRPTSKTTRSSRQQSRVLHPSSNNTQTNGHSRPRSNASISTTLQLSTKNDDLDNQHQHGPIESFETTEIPIPLTSPDENAIPASSSRAATPVRRNSVSSLDHDMLLTTNDILDLDEPQAQNLEMLASQPSNSEGTEPVPSNTIETLPDIEHDLLSNEDRSPVSSTNDLENNLTKSISQRSVDTNKTQDNNLHSISRSSTHSFTSDVRRASLKREHTFQNEISSDSGKAPSTEDSSKPKKSPTDPPDKTFPPITESQRRSKLSLIVYRSKPKQKELNDSQPSKSHTRDLSLVHTNKKSKDKHHVSYSNDVSYFPQNENFQFKSRRRRISNVLKQNYLSNAKYPYVQSRVDTFANFDHQPKSFVSIPKKKQNKKKVLEQQTAYSRKKSLWKSFGRIQRTPNGTPYVYTEKLQWKSQSKIRSYSQENIQRKPGGSHSRIFNQTPRWNSESKIAEFINEHAFRQSQLNMLSPITTPDRNQLLIHRQGSSTETKIFDVNSKVYNDQTNFGLISIDPDRSTKIIFDEKLSWNKKSKIKEMIAASKNYQPRQSRIKIFHQAVRWKSESKIKVTQWNIHGKIDYWSEDDLPQLTQKKALFAQYYDPKWNDIAEDHVPAPNSRESVTEELNLKDSISSDRLHPETQIESPANRPKWNSVSKTRSLNVIYNPNLSNSNYIRKGWDFEVRRRRVHKLPPLKRKRDHDKLPQLSLEEPPANELLAIDYSGDPSSITHDRLTSTDFRTISSRPSSKALVPLHHIPHLDLSSETPRSKRPIQQEWYEEMNRSRLTHRTDMGRLTNNSFRESALSNHHNNTPRDALAIRSSTRNSQNSTMSGTLLDSTIRTNRTTELRLSRDMDEHHQHSHDPSQSMPLEIRGFQLEGTPLTVPDNATIRPLSNISYRTSELVKHRRLFPWSVLHPHGSLSRNSLLLPIAEHRHPSFQTSTSEMPQLVREE